MVMAGLVSKLRIGLFKLQETVDGLLKDSSMGTPVVNPGTTPGLDSHEGGREPNGPRRLVHGDPEGSKIGDLGVGRTQVCPNSHKAENWNNGNELFTKKHTLLGKPFP